ncbi:hypothetical protein QJQ45_018578 [Haematococcus lacustris]|nr:hypothetical protein QJQ45_018578 [Haematococcus lacustris]
MGPGLAESSRLRQEAFAQLRPVCAQLLQHRCDAPALHKGLSSLQQLVEQLPAHGLAGCWDYLTFPLLLLLDSGAEARSTGPAGSGGGQVAVPAARSDRVMEAVLGLISTLCSRCLALPCGPDPDQVLGCVQRLAPLLQLTAGQAAEEVRSQAFQLMATCCQAQPAPSPLTPAPQPPRPPPSDPPEDLDLDALLLSSYTDLKQQEQQEGEGEGGGSGPGLPRAPGPLLLLLWPFSWLPPDSAPLVGFLVHTCLAASECEALALAGLPPPPLAPPAPVGVLAVGLVGAQRPGQWQQGEGARAAVRCSARRCRHWGSW